MKIGFLTRRNSLLLGGLILLLVVLVMTAVFIYLKTVEIGYAQPASAMHP